jgi:hypothetical protein
MAKNIPDQWLELIRFVQQQFFYCLNRDVSHYPISINGLIQGEEESVVHFTKLLVLAQVECENSEEFLPRILQLSDGAKAFLADVVDQLRGDPRVDYTELLPQTSKDDSLLRSRISELEDQLRVAKTRTATLEEQLRNAEVVAEESTTHIRKLMSDIESLNRKFTDKKSMIKDPPSIEVAQIRESTETSDSAMANNPNQPGLDSGQLTQSDHKLVRSQVDRSEAIERENGSLKLQLEAVRTELNRSQTFAEEQEKQLGQFVMTGGALGGQIRDRVLRTLQEQLLVRDEEIELMRQQIVDIQEESRKGHNLLVTAVHSLSLRYHEEMFRQLRDSETHQTNTVPSPEDFYSQEYNNL